MQMLAGVITESEYKAKLEEVSALMKYASKDAKARDVEQSDREYIATRQKRDKLAKELFNKASYRDLSNVQKDRVNNQLTEDQNEEKDSLNEHYVAGGIVGIGVITQIPSRAKTDYEDAFEHFLGKKYEINEEMEEVEDVKEGVSALPFRKNMENAIEFVNNNEDFSDSAKAKYIRAIEFVVYNSLDPNTKGGEYPPNGFQFDDAWWNSVGEVNEYVADQLLRDISDAKRGKMSWL
jgi:hypothetical protein